MIRYATKSDIYDIARIKVSSWKKNYIDILDSTYLCNMDIDYYCEKYISSFNKFNYIVYEENNKILGFCKFNILKKGIYDAEIYSLYVDNKYKRLGIGSKMFNYVINELKKQGILKVKIWCLKENNIGNSFYVKKGCKLVEIKKDNIDGVNDVWFNGYIYELMGGDR